MTILKKIRNKYINTVGFLFLCILFIGINASDVEAADNQPVSTQITYGFGGVTKLSAHTPFKISITNGGSEINGKVQVILSSFSDSNSTANAVLNSGYKEKNYMYEKTAKIAANATTDVSMVLPLMNPINKMKITVYDEYGNVLSTQEQVIETEDYTYYLYAAILCDEPSIINYFQNTAIYQNNDFTYKAIILNPADIPTDNYGLELFNVMIVSQKQLDNLSKEQQKVLYNWQKNGGILVNTETLKYLPDVTWENAIPQSELKKLESSYQSYEEWSILYALSNVFMDNVPSFTLYLVIILIYILLVGPLLYLILKKLNKRNLFWIIEISSSILFTIFIIALGSTTRLNAPFINYFNIVSYNKDSIDDSVYFDIQAPFNNAYKLYLDKDYSFMPIYDTIYVNELKKLKNVDDYNIGISHDEQENTIIIKNDAAFTKEYFYAEKSEKANGNEHVNVQMNMFGDKITGMVTNNLDTPIENAVILKYNKAIFLETIPAHSSVSLDDMKIYTYNPKFTYGLTNEITGLKMNRSGVIEKGYMLQNQKKSILDYFLEKKFNVNTNEAYLVGFTTEMNKLELQLDSSYDAYGLTMLEVPIDVNYTNDNLLYTSYVPIKNEEYSSSGDIMYSDEMILTYNLGTDLTDIDLYFNDLSYYDEEYYKAFSGHIYFYNQFTSLYDPVDLSSKHITIEQLKPYLNEENEIVIKYVEEFGKEEKQALLPSLSTIGRVNDAQN